MANSRFLLTHRTGGVSLCGLYLSLKAHFQCPINHHPTVCLAYWINQEKKMMFVPAGLFNGVIKPVWIHLEEEASFPEMNNSPLCCVTREERGCKPKSGATYFGSFLQKIEVREQILQNQCL
ncbi:uncharacterized protein LOC144287461 isoform X2 [Canis aureus]